MRIPALVQASAVDVVDWTPDAEFAVFPVGARAKEALIAPEAVPAHLLKPRKRYLFKLSKRSYPDQFWGEVIAYRIGCLLGVPVPPAFYAINSGTHVAAALIEWFYEGSELFMHGGDFLVAVRSTYDRERGTQHNLEDVRILLQALARTQRFTEDWRQWWISALTFDALIGNTDRHQDNWGLIFEPTGSANPGRDLPCRLAPLFDNGTSLGHERFMERVNGWSEDQIMRYVARGTHHVKWSLTEPVNGHFDLLSRALAAWPSGVDTARVRLEIREDELIECFEDLVHLAGPVSLSNQRFDFIARLLRTRFRILKRLLNDAPSIHR